MHSTLPTECRDLETFLARAEALRPADWRMVVVAWTGQESGAAYRIAVDALPPAAVAAAREAARRDQRREAAHRRAVVATRIAAIVERLLVARALEPKTPSAHAAGSAMIAVAAAFLVRDRITTAQFEALYRPFQEVIPLASLS